MKYLTIFLLVISLNIKADESILFDEDFAKLTDEILDTAFINCSDIFNMAKKSDCVSKEVDELNKKHSTRGSKWYQKNVLNKLNLTQSKKALKERKKLYETAVAENIYSYSVDFGYLTAEILGTEIYYLEDKIRKFEAEGKPTLAEQAEALGLPGLAQEVRNATGQ